MLVAYILFGNPMLPVPSNLVKWPSWAPKWSIISAAAILAASVTATVILSIESSSDTTAPTATDAGTPAQTFSSAPAAQPGTPTETSPDALQLRIARLAAELAATPVHVRTEVGEAQLTVADFGIKLNGEATFRAVHQRRSQGDWSDQDSATESWSALSVDPLPSERRYQVDRVAARALLRDATELGVTAIPPVIVVVNNSLAVDLGQPGQLIDVDDAVDQVLEGIARTIPRIEITAKLRQSRMLELTPELQRAVNEAQARYGRSLVVTYGGVSHELALESIADWLTLDPDESPPMISFSHSRVSAYLEEVFAAQSAPVTTAAMAVVNGVPTVMARDGSETCCADEVAAEIEQALLNAAANPLVLPGRPAISREEQAYLESLGIIELVGSFTTMHECCKSRVANIQRFADLMRGVIVAPGESLSLNGHVGRRTEEKGFVEGGFIEKGVLVEDIGGGVSQFATTIFNALIRAGMDIDEYQTHSLYLSRYPYGLDPTISYPKPDLRFTNPTPYGILIWPKYTDTSISVDIYSTRNVEVSIGEPEEEMREFCQRVRTDRRRVFSDGTAQTDTFWARYRPEEGRNCDGTRSVPRRCVDPLGISGEAADVAPDGEAPDELAEDGSERADGTIVMCPPVECVEKPGERDSELPRYPDDPCLGVDLEELARNNDTEGDAETDSGTSSGTGGSTSSGTGNDSGGSTSNGNGNGTGSGEVDSGDGTSGSDERPGGGKPAGPDGSQNNPPSDSNPPSDEADLGETSEPRRS